MTASVLAVWLTFIFLLALVAWLIFPSDHA